jgi:predicted dehydrogenase
MNRFRWGIFGTGAISAKFVAGLAAAYHADAAFVASRSLDKAQAFAGAFGIPRAIEGYAEAARAGGVDAIYIATPPSEHLSHALMCIDAGFPVLVEKPMARTAAEVVRIRDAARTKGVFAMEAMWTRFLPAAQALRDTVAAHAIGDIRFVASNFGVSRNPDPADPLFNPVLGGGALAHLGPYPLSLAQWLFGTPKLVQATGTIGTFDVDEDAAFQLRYDCDIIGSFFVSIRAWAPDAFEVLGSEGTIAVRGPLLRPHGLEIRREPPRSADVAQLEWRGRLRQTGFVHTVAQWLGRASRHRGKRFNIYYAGNGYHYEANEVRACVARGATESSFMRLSESIAVASTLDTIREALTDLPRGTQARLSGSTRVRSKQAC